MELEDRFCSIADRIPTSYLLDISELKDETVDDEFLSTCLEFLNITIDREYINIFKSYLILAEKCYNILKEKDYVILLPGDSPTIFWSCLIYLYPDVKEFDHIIFPISGIRDYVQLRREFEHEMDYLEDCGQDERYNSLETKIDKSYIDEAEQDKFMEEYIGKILKNYNKDTNFICIDYTFRGRFEVELNKTLKKLGFINKLEFFNVFYNFEGFRCIQKFNVGDTDMSRPHNYLGCNTILYVLSAYLKDSVKVTTLNDEISRGIEMEKYKIYQFDQKHVFLKYVGVRDNEIYFEEYIGVIEIVYSGSFVKFGDKTIKSKTVYFIKEIA